MQEIDCIRLISNTQHEILQKVPDVVQKIFRINSTEPGSFLLEASKQYQVNFYIIKLGFYLVCWLFIER